jgi:hypothetical protein
MEGATLVDLNRDTPRDVEWYHWALSARRALTVLQTTQGVDPNRLGVFGISMGGTLTWMVAGTDERVKVAVPIYGVGWTSYPELDNGDVTTDPNTTLRRALLEAEAYAPYVKCPLLYLDAANDFYGRLDFAMRTLDCVPAAEKRMAFTPQYVHHIGAQAGADLPQWMDLHLKKQGQPWPATPALKFAGGSDGLQLMLKSDRPHDVEHVEIYYGLNTPRAPQRFYRRIANVKRDGDVYIGETPYFAPTDILHAYANVTYHSGITLSSPIVAQQARLLPHVAPTLHSASLIDAMDSTDAWFVRYAETDPWHAVNYFVTRSVDGRTGLAPYSEATRDTRPQAFNFATLKLADPQWHGEGQTPLRIDVATAGKPLVLKVEIRSNYTQANEIEYHATAQPPRQGASGWLTYQFVPADFKDSSGRTLQAWNDVQYLNFSADWSGPVPPMFRNLRWAR